MPQDRTALYRFHDCDERLLYVGISRNPSKRFERHAGEKHWWGQVARIDLEWFPTRAEALIAEQRAIVAEAPLHNVVHSQFALRAGDLTLTWQCEVCAEEIGDGAGYLWVHTGEVHQLEREEADRVANHSWESIDLERLLFEPRRGCWHAHHKRCDPDIDAPSYTIAVERIRTIAHLLNWTSHLLGKRWIQTTDWDHIVDTAAGQVGRVDA